MSNKNRMISIGARAGGADRDGACRLNSKKCRAREIRSAAFRMLTARHALGPLASISGIQVCKRRINEREKNKRLVRSRNDARNAPAM